ncbi:hypothetical protein GN156_12310 [bacterium LRH843]|nr:hypothetical protein [bacterium LRH843]
MKKIAMSIAAATMLLGGLTACGTNQANDNNGNMGAKNYRNTGYGYEAPAPLNGTYNGTYKARYRGQGPVTDMMTPDHRYRVGTNGYNNNRTYNNRVGVTGVDGNRNGVGMMGVDGNRNGVGMMGVDGYSNRVGMTGVDGYSNRAGVTGVDGYRDGMHTRSYDGMGTRSTGHHAGTMNYHRDYDGNTARHIADRVVKISGVKDARVIVHKNDVVVGVDADGGNLSHITKEVEHKVKGLAHGKKVHVVTDRDSVHRIRTMDDRLRTGTAFQEVGTTFTDMMRDIGSAAARPFERTR